MDEGVVEVAKEELVSVKSVTFVSLRLGDINYSGYNMWSFEVKICLVNVNAVLSGHSSRNCYSSQEAVNDVSCVNDDTNERFFLFCFFSNPNLRFLPVSSVTSTLPGTSELKMGHRATVIGVDAGDTQRAPDDRRISGSGGQIGGVE